MEERTARSRFLALLGMEERRARSGFLAALGDGGKKGESRFLALLGVEERRAEAGRAHQFSERSIQVGLAASIRAIFLSRVQLFNSSSRRMAERTYWKCST